VSVSLLRLGIAASGARSTAAPLLLDLVAGAAIAHSLRKVRSAYAGSAIRVRRSSDNAEADIGFVGIDLDTASLLAFAGSGSAFVVTWYDQSTNAQHATQTTAASQPRIVNAGALEVGGASLGALRFLAASNHHLSSPYLFGTAATVLASVHNLTRSAAATVIAERSATNGFPSPFQLDFAPTDRPRLFLRSDDGATASAVSAVSYFGAWLLLTGVREVGTTSRVRRNASQLSSVNATLGATTAGATQIGAHIRSTTNGLDGWMREVIVYPSALSSADLATAEANMNAYGGMY